MLNAAYEQIVDVSRIGEHGKVDFNVDLMSLAEKERLRPANQDAIKRLLLCIDVQKDFIEGGALAVPNSIGDVERITRFIHKNMEGISKIMCSMDTHTPYQIFHPAWWVNPDNEHPAPYTIITYDDVKHDVWRPIVSPVVDSITYLQKLEEVGAGKKQLCIWPYHCINGTDGFTLENEFSKMVYYHSVAKKTRNRIVNKGQDSYSEMYGIIKPEYSKTNFVKTTVLNAIESFEEIYVVGEAASHCLMESVKQIAENFAGRPEVTSKITVLEDCTSPIAGFEQATADAFDFFKSNYGIKFAKSIDITF